MATLARGQKTKLADIGCSGPFPLVLQVAAAGMEIDIACFGLDANDKLSDDRYMVFFNQTACPGDAVTLSIAADQSTFNINLAGLPSSIQKLVFTASITGAGSMRSIGASNLRLGDATFAFSGSDFQDETTIIVGELYQRDNQWRFGAVGQGLNGGLPALLTHFGYTERETEHTPPTLAQEPVVQVPVVEEPKKASSNKGFANGVVSAVSDIFKASKIRNENDRLKEVIGEAGGIDAVKIIERVEQQKKILETLENKCIALRNNAQSLDIDIESKKKELIVIDEALLLESFALYKPKFKFLTSEEYKNRLSTCREAQKEQIKRGSAVTANENWTVNNSQSEGKKMVSDMKKLLLRSFNNECDVCVDNVKFNNVEASKLRIEKSFDALSKLGRIMNAQISQLYLNLKLDELHIAYEYQQRKQEEKEEQQRIREELREQQKLEIEIRQARERIAKERKHFTRAISDLEDRLVTITDESERAPIILKLNELQSAYEALANEEKVIDYREKNAKAGYVYIISNLGSFGENIFKIGMTRRLEPQDRIDELGTASVPFRFDVHALIFSDNAPDLESKIHQKFHKNRINKINGRKEFFKVHIDEIELVIKENYNKTVEINKIPNAEQYREGLLL